MYLYLNDPSRSVAQLNRHVSHFRELSNTWGIGEQTFEFWSWLSKQCVRAFIPSFLSLTRFVRRYRLFADLVAIAIRAGLRIPSLRPPPTARSTPAGMPQPPSSELAPGNVLQHPGYYFYLSGTCAVERRERFRAIAKAEVRCCLLSSVEISED